MPCLPNLKHCLAFPTLQADELKCVTSSFDSSVKIWDMRRGLAQRAELHAQIGCKYTRVVFNDTRVITGSLDGSFTVFDII